MKNVRVWSRSRLEPPFFAWSRSRPSVVGAGVGSGTSDLRSWSRPKKWRLCNTDCMVYSLKYTFTRLAYTTYPFSFISGADCEVENLPQEWLNLLDCGDLLFCSTAPGSHNSMPDLSGVRYRYPSNPTVDFFLVNIDTYRYW